MDESGIIWGESVEYQVDSVANSFVTKIYDDNMSLECSCELPENSTPVFSPAIMESKDNHNFSNSVMNMSSCNDKNYYSNDNNENKCIVNDSNSGSDEIVFRRTRGRKTRKEKTKCVSFHEDSSKSDFKNTLMNVDNKRLSVNDTINLCMEEVLPSNKDNEVEKENFSNFNEDHVSTNESSFALGDNEVCILFLEL